MSELDPHPGSPCDWNGPGAACVQCLDRIKHLLARVDALEAKIERLEERDRINVAELNRRSRVMSDFFCRNSDLTKLLRRSEAICRDWDLMASEAFTEHAACIRAELNVSAVMSAENS